MIHRARLRLSLLIAIVSVLPAAPSARAETPPSAAGLAPTEVFHRMLPTTVWVRKQWVDGNLERWTAGTGWVYDVGQRLVVTNEHVVHNFDEMDCYFPETVGSELQHDPAFYLKNGHKFKATVIDRDTARDLALLQLDALPDGAMPLKLAEKSPQPGERIFALAALPEGSEGLWIMTSGEVRQVYRRSNANRHFERVVETQLPTNRGNSGGAVVNDRLDVVAVVEGHMLEARLVSMFIDVGEVRDYLAEATPLVEPATADDFQTRAARRFDEKRYDQAIADYSAALRLEPNSAPALMNRGWMFESKGDYETAIADFNAAIAVDRELRGAYEGRGTCYREMERYDEAIRDFTEAIRRDANDADTYERRAKCYQEQEQYARALKDRDRALELAPQEVNYLHGRGQTLRTLKRYDEARENFEKAIALDPSRSATFYELGWVYFDQEDYERAKLFYSMAVEREPTETAYINMHGLCLLRTDQYEPAAADFAKAVQLNPHKPLYHWHLGLAMWYMDRYNEALQSITQYIRLEPEDAAGYDLRADVYEAMEQNDLAAADREAAARHKADE